MLRRFQKETHSVDLARTYHDNPDQLIQHMFQVVSIFLPQQKRKSDNSLELRLAGRESSPLFVVVIVHDVSLQLTDRGTAALLVVVTLRCVRSSFPRRRVRATIFSISAPLAIPVQRLHHA